MMFCTTVSIRWHDTDYLEECIIIYGSYKMSLKMRYQAMRNNCNILNLKKKYMYKNLNLVYYTVPL